MSLVAFCFMGGGGVGTAIGSRLIATYGLLQLFIIYGVALVATLCLSFILIRGRVVGISPFLLGCRYNRIKLQTFL